MIDASECRFCCGEPVNAEATVGEGIKTMSMMIDLMFGSIRSSTSEYVKNGIQLEDGNMMVFDNSAREYIPLGIRIGYCPFCGRELKQESNEED